MTVTIGNGGAPTLAMAGGKNREHSTKRHQYIKPYLEQTPTDQQTKQTTKALRLLVGRWQRVFDIDRSQGQAMRSRGLALTLAICQILRGVALFKAPRHPSSAAARPGLKENRKLNNADRQSILRGLDSTRIMSDKVLNQETPLISSNVNDNIQSVIATPQWFRDMFDWSRNKPLTDPASVFKLMEVVVSKFVLEVLGASGEVSNRLVYLSIWLVIWLATVLQP